MEITLVSFTQFRTNSKVKSCNQSLCEFYSKVVLLICGHKFWSVSKHWFCDVHPAWFPGFRQSHVQLNSFRKLIYIVLSLPVLYLLGLFPRVFPETVEYLRVYTRLVRFFLYVKFSLVSFKYLSNTVLIFSPLRLRGHLPLSVGDSAASSAKSWPNYFLLGAFDFPAYVFSLLSQICMKRDG